MEFIPAWLWFLIGVFSLALWVIQFIATVRTETHLKKILELLEGQQSTQFGIAQSLQAIQRNTQPLDKDP